MTNEPKGPGIESLLEAWEQLAPRERKVVCTFAWRVAAGQRRFGPLTIGKKDWTYEALEEVLDACVYMSAALSDKTDIAFDRMVADAEAEVSFPDREWVEAAEASYATSQRCGAEVQSPDNDWIQRAHIDSGCGAV